MSEFMRAIDFGHLIKWCLSEYEKEQRVLGIRADQFYRNKSGQYYTTVFGDKLASPIGPAAGPQSQLAQNIIVSYLTGARFMELKTVQKMDGEEIRLAVKKPCILAEDEGYNCEWSTELTVQEAFDEYLKGYFAIKVLAVEFGISDGNDFAYNMSVGYDLDGIKLPKIDAYIEGLKDASDTDVFRACKQWLQDNLQLFTHFGQQELEAISPEVCHSITLSTLHGCPPDEIERIATYLLTEKHLNTFVKCNPTMLGYEFARQTLDELGYDYIAFTDHHFKADLQFADAITMFKRLIPLSEQLGLKFGVKLTNTFPVDVDQNQLPSQEMYMSGRSLMALSINLANKLSQEFDGKLPISFSGGADALNIVELLETGIGPVTMATTILKPGGYVRFKQIAEEAEKVEAGEYKGIDVAKLKALAASVLKDERNHKRYREKVKGRKTKSELPLFDCFKAPCKDGGCPINQQIPEYLQLVAQGDYDAAIELISVDNTAPTVLGALCSQPCRDKCTRLDYDQSLEMRQIKLAAADHGQDQLTARTTAQPLRSEKKAAIIGAGPAGIAAGVFLRRNGIAADVFEKLDRSYGIVRYIIPSFRISDAQMDRDFRAAEAEGVKFHFNADPNYDIGRLKESYDYIFLATGAWKEGYSPVEEGQENVQDALKFLWEAKNEGGVKLGRRVAVVGAGDVAMDCARLALRTEGVEKVDIVYRRTEPYMPATQEEVNEARAEGITIHELLAPVKYLDGVLTCEKMKLGDYEASGRKSCVGLGDFVDLEYDNVIGATGAQLDTADYVRVGINLNERKKPKLNAACESSLEDVYVIGDGRRGPSTIVEAIADAKAAVASVMEKEGLSFDFARPEVEAHAAALYQRRAYMETARRDDSEGERCLKCDQICEICTEVCPNRANVVVAMPGFKNGHQIIHLDGMCNECGNCAVFCPHAGKPYKDKLTVFWTEEDFHESEHVGFLKQEDGSYLFRNEQGTVATVKKTDAQVSAEIKAAMDVLESQYAFYLSQA